jgi:hypothetical protein
MRAIPAVWRIDVEPDDFVPGPTAPPWTGFEALAAFIEEMRGRLSDLSGSPFHPTWFFRLDPDVERWYGRADFVVERYGSLIDRLRTHGDPLGVHVHYYRWDDARQVSYSEHADGEWIVHCVDTALTAFEKCFAERVRRSSQGTFSITEACLNRLVERGVEVDLTPEPGRPAVSHNASFASHATAASTDYTHAPRRPYYPSRLDACTPAASAADARPLLMVPLTSYDYERAMASWTRRFAKAVLRWPSRHQPLNPHKAWPDPHTYWDLVERAADEGPACYVALAVRTDPAGTLTHGRSQPLFEYLPRHPIAKRLRFVDPLAPEIRGLAQMPGGRP